MSDPQPPEAAVEAVMKALREYPGLVYARADVALPQVSAAVLTAALPHLYRDWLEGLIAKYEAQWKSEQDNHRAEELFYAIKMLRAELDQEGTLT